jgi:hypothetical protein
LEGYRLTCNVQRLLHGLDSEVIFTLRGKEKKKQRSALEDGFSFSKHHRVSRRHLMSSASKFKLPKLPSSCLLKVGDLEHWGSWPGGGRGLSSSAAPWFEFLCAHLSFPRCLTYPLGLQGVQWALRLVVVRASWPGHPRKSKKKVGDLDSILKLKLIMQLIY